MCSTRGRSLGMYITFASAKKKENKAEPTLAFKPREDVTRNPKQGDQWPQKKDMCPPKTLKKKKYFSINNRFKNEVNLLNQQVQLGCPYTLDMLTFCEHCLKHE